MQSSNIDYVLIPRVGVVVVVSGGHEMNGQPDDSVSGWCRLQSGNRLTDSCALKILRPPVPRDGCRIVNSDGHWNLCNSYLHSNIQ